MIDRLPPNSIETEQALLGCVFADPRTVMPIVRAAGSDDLFYDLRHQIIFDHLAAIEDEGKPVGIISLHESMKMAGQLEAVGGLPYIGSLQDFTPSAANAEYYLEILIEKATLRKLIQVCTKAITEAYDGEKTAEEVVAAAEMEILKVRRQKNRQLMDMRELVHEAITEIEHLHQQQGAISGLSTGLVDLDKVSDGLHPGEMIVVAGFPGSGKSAIAMNFAEHQAVDCRNGVGVFSFEMTAKRLVLRLLASRSRVNLRSIRDGFLAERDFPKLTAAAGKLMNSNIHICDISDLTIAQLRAQARRMVQQHELKLFIVDYIQLVASNSRREQNREQEVALISRGLKMMAAELNVPVIALSQLNDDGKLRESRAIGQDADTVWTLRIADEKKANDIVVPIALDIRKQRDGQAPATVHLTFFKAYTRFESAAKVDHPQQDIPPDRRFKE